ncbi:MAG: MCE family protein [Flavobacterium sp.]|nr:MCE family protein [Flavobacterium sp.]
MKLTKEIKTAILVISSILLFIWGYGFLKGHDLLTNYKVLFVKYDNVDGLAIAAPVTLSGLPIGSVKKITLQKTTGKLIVELQIKSDFPISKSSEAQMYSPSALGGKQIAILPNLADKSIAESGNYLKSSEKQGITDALVSQVGPVKDKIEKVLDNANVLLESVNQVFDQKTRDNLQASLNNLNQTLAQFKIASTQVNELLADNKTKISSTISNIDKASSNFAKLSDSLSKANIAKTIAKLENTLASVDKIVFGLQSGKGTMGKILKDETLYNNFSKTSKELELLLQDVRLYPTRYVNVSLFGKKNKPYKAPINDSIKK